MLKKDKKEEIILKNNMAKIFCIVGCSGSGKSNYIKSKFLPACKKHIILDVNNEYKDFNTSHDNNIITFLENTKKLVNTLVVIDEASIYYEEKFNSKDLTMLTKELTTLKRHMNNNYIFVFHSLTEIPRIIRKRIEIIILFKTIESYSDIARLYGKNHTILKVWADVKRNPYKHFYKTLNYNEL